MRHARWFAGLLFLFPALLLAQSQGRIKGLVKDTKGVPVAGAKVIVTCPEIVAFRQEKKTDEKGGFATLVVDATKRYLFHIEAPGFQPSEGLYKPLIGGQTLDIDFELVSLQELQQRQEQQMMDQPGIKEVREGKELLAAGKRAEARAKFEAATTLKPDLYLAWAEMGIMDLADKKPDTALAAAEKCLALQPNFTPCLALATNAAKEKGDTAAYERYLAAYKMANPSDPVVLFNEAAAALNRADDTTAKPLLEQVLEIDPGYADALFQLGMIYVRTGESAKAKELLQKFLEVAPQHKEAPTATEMMKYL
jgi:tetratricopeptide (TPR) repeat protein